MVILFQVFSAEANWPQWRGPLHTGVAPSAKPPVQWSETNNVRWKVKVPGIGAGTPIVWENMVFLQTAVPTGEKIEAAKLEPAAPTAEAQGGRRGGPMRSEKPTEFHRFMVHCLDRKTGQTLWEKVAREEVPHEGYRQNDGSFASGSPVTDGKHVYAFFGSRGVHCYDFRGERLWETDLGDMQTRNSFGEGSSPALYGNTLVINWDHEGNDFVVALDKQTGREIWRKLRDEATSWSTPLVVDRGGQAQVVVSASNKVRSYELGSGKLIWECGGLGPNVIPTPVADHEKVYVMSGFRQNSLLAIQLGRTGDLTGGDAVVWTLNKSTPYVPSPLLDQGRLYFLGGNNAFLSCFEAATGKPLVEAQRIEGLQTVYASPVSANGYIYLFDRVGGAVVLKHSDKLEVIATNRLDEKFDASPALAGDALFVRGQQYVYCLAQGAN
jgi:outer membrane protein assembly factor BamB